MGDYLFVFYGDIYGLLKHLPYSTWYGHVQDKNVDITLELSGDQ